MVILISSRAFTSPLFVWKVFPKDREKIREISGQDVDSTIADYRYRFITDQVARATKKIGKSHLAFEDRLDKVLMNRYAALPIFFIFMFIIYFVSINVVGDGTTGLIEGFISGTLIGELSSSL